MGWTDTEIGMMVMSNKNSNYIFRGKIHELLYWKPIRFTFCCLVKEICWENQKTLRSDWLD